MVSFNLIGGKWQIKRCISNSNKLFLVKQLINSANGKNSLNLALALNYIRKLRITITMSFSFIAALIESINYCLLTHHKPTVLLIFPKNVHILLFGNLEWNHYVFTPDEFLPVGGAFTSHVTVAVDAGEEITIFARVDTAIQSAATQITNLPRMFQPH